MSTVDSLPLSKSEFPSGSNNGKKRDDEYRKRIMNIQGMFSTYNKTMKKFYA